jgi:DNA-binding transcriptional LysR family regulator
MADFRRLGYFLQIADLGSLTRTAERLRIAQPSLSRQMRLLEEELGVALFTRGPRGMQLTEAGESLRMKIAGPLRQVGHALYEIRSLPSDTEGMVIFGVPPSVGSLLGIPLLQRIRQETPRVGLQIVEAPSGHLLSMMKRGELDAAVLYGPTPAGLNAARLLDDELVLISAPHTVPGRAIDFRRLSEFELVLPSESQGLRIAIEGIAAKTRTRLSVALQIDSLVLIKSVVSAGELHSIVPFSCISDLEMPRLLVTRLRKPLPLRHLYLTMQSEAESPRAVLQVEQFAREEASALVSSGIWTHADIFTVGDS